MFLGAGAKFIVFVCWRISTQINGYIWCYSKDTSVQSEIILPVMQISIMCQKNSPLTLTQVNLSSSLSEQHEEKPHSSKISWINFCCVRTLLTLRFSAWPGISGGVVLHAVQSHKAPGGQGACGRCDRKSQATHWTTTGCSERTWSTARWLVHTW